MTPWLPRASVLLVNNSLRVELARTSEHKFKMGTASRIGNDEKSKEKASHCVTKLSTQFISRNIVRKKKKPQQRIEKYFPITKPRGTTVERNFQGFPLAHCHYEEEIGKFIYRPPCYYYGNKKKNNEEEDCLAPSTRRRKNCADIVCSVLVL